MRDEDRDIRLHQSRIYREMLNNQIKLNHQFRRQMDQLSLRPHRPRLLTQSSVLTELLRKKEQRQSSFLPSIFDRNMPIQSESRFLELPVSNSPPPERLSPVKELVTDFEEDDYGASCEQIIIDLQQINERSWKDLRKISEQSRNRMRTEQNYPRIGSRTGNYGGRIVSPASRTLDNTRVNYQSLGNPERVVPENKGMWTDPRRMEFKVQAQENNYSMSNQGSSLRNQINPQSRKIDSRLSAISKVSSEQNQKPASPSPSPLVRLKKEKFIQQLRRANNRGQSLEVKLRFLRSKRARGK